MTKKIEKVEMEAKPEPKLGAPMTPGKLRRFLQSRDVSARLEPDDRPVAFGPRGPATGESGSPKAELMRMVTEEEAAEFVEALKKKRGATELLWMQCDNGQCGYVGRYRPSVVGQACAVCNFRRLLGMGHLQTMTSEAVAEWQKAKAAKEAELRARDELATLAQRNEARVKQGLVPMTLEDLRAANRRDFERRVEADRKLAEIHERVLQEKAAKEAAAR